jgi:uncharacterized OB-fold protein
MASAVDPADPAGRIAFKRGFLVGDLAVLETVRFAGIRCGSCGIALLGRRRRCENCASTEVAEAQFALTGRVHTYTIQRYPPPAPFVAPQPWIPRGLAWIDLDDQGPRILGPVEGPAEQVSIGLRVVARFSPGWRDDRGREVIAFSFAPVSTPPQVAS